MFEKNHHFHLRHRDASDRQRGQLRSSTSPQAQPTNRRGRFPAILHHEEPQPAAEAREPVLSTHGNGRRFKVQVSLDVESHWASEDFTFRKGEVPELSFVAEDEAEGEALLGIEFNEEPAPRAVRGEEFENGEWIFSILG